MDNKKALIGAGLSPKETSVYLASYELGEATIARISQKSGIKRSTAYLEIENLVKKGLISRATRNNKKYYIAESPKNILAMLEDNKRALEKAMPSLLGLGLAVDKKPQIRFFEGMEGIKEVFRATLEFPGQEILSFFSGPLSVEDNEFQINYYIPERIKRKIWVRGIVPDSKKMAGIYAKNAEHLRRVKKVDPEEFNMNNEIIVYGQRNVAIVSLGDQIGIIIESEQISKSLRQIFEIIWKALPEDK